jgi:hypothetical protein
MNVFSEVWIEMSAKSAAEQARRNAEYIARLQRQLEEDDAAEARILAEYAKRIEKLEMVEKIIIARVDDLYTSLAPGQTANARQATLNQQIARIRASYGPEPGAEPGSQPVSQPVSQPRGGRRYTRAYKRAHKRMHKQTHRRAHRR